MGWFVPQQRLTETEAHTQNLNVEKIYLQYIDTFIKTCRARYGFLNPLTFREALREMNPWKRSKEALEAWGHLRGDSGLQKERAAALAPQTPCPGERRGQSRAKRNFLNEGPKADASLAQV